MKFLFRLKEPSTWAGFAVLGAVFGIKELAAFSAPDFAACAAAVASIFLPEQSDK